MRGYEIKERDTAVLQVRELSITGTVIPPQWLKTITFDNGRPNVIACLILADVVYWYRPIEIRNELTGEFVGWRKRFKADLLQRNYADIGATYGLTKRQVSDNAKRLEEDHGVIRREFRTVTMKNGRKANNVLFIDLNVDRLRELTYGGTLSRSSVTGYHVPAGDPVTLKRDTKTKNTTENTYNLSGGEDAAGEGSEKTTRKLNERQRVIKSLEVHFCNETGLPLPAAITGREKKAAAVAYWLPLERMYKAYTGKQKTRVDQEAIDAVKEIITELKDHFRAEGLTLADPRSIERTGIAWIAERKQDRDERQAKTAVVAAVGDVS